MAGTGGSTLCSLRLRPLGRVPVAAEGFDQLDAGSNSEIHGLSQRELVGEERPLGVDDDQAIHQAMLALRLHEARGASATLARCGASRMACSTLT